MSGEAEIEGKPQQQKLQEKGSILSYFKKKDVTPVESKCNGIIDGKQSYSVALKDHLVVENSGKNKEAKDKRDQEVNDDLCVVEEVKPKKGVPITKAKKEHAVAKEQTSAKMELHSTDDEEEEASPILATPILGSNQETNTARKELNETASTTLHVKSENVAGKGKNVFAFMMASSARQNDAIKKMAEEEEDTQQKQQDNEQKQQDNESKKGLKSVKDKELQTPKKSEVRTSRDECSKLMKGLEMKVHPLKAESSPSKTKATQSKRKNSLKSRKQQVKVRGRDFVPSSEDDDFISSDKGETIEKVSEKEKSEVKITEVKICKPISEQTQLTNKSEDVDCKEATVFQASSSSGGNRTSGFSKKLETPLPSKGNAFTLLMTNRHKMNNSVSLEKKDSESEDDNRGIVDSKYCNRKRKSTEKSPSLETGKSRQKRKRRSSQNPDSSLHDFKVTPKKKSRKKRQVTKEKRKSSDNDPSSSEEEEDIPCFEISSENNTTVSSSDEMDIIGKESDKKRRIRRVISSGDECSDESKEISGIEMGSDTEEEAETIDSMNHKNVLKVGRNGKDDGNNKEMKINGGCSNALIGDEINEIDTESEDELVLGCGSGGKLKGSGEEVSNSCLGSDAPDEASSTNMSKETEVDEKSAGVKNVMSLGQTIVCNSGESNLCEDRGVTSDTSNISKVKQSDEALKSQLKKTEEEESGESLMSQLRNVRKNEISGRCITREVVVNKEQVQVRGESMEKFSGDLNSLEVKGKESGFKMKSSDICSEGTFEPPKKKRKRFNLIESDDDDEEISENTNAEDNTEKVREETSNVPKKDNDDNDGAYDKNNEKANSEDDTEKVDEKSPDGSKKGNIFSFFKKISKEEKDSERSKTVITVKADVHAPCEGLTQNNKGKRNVPGKTKNVRQGKERSRIRRSSRRLRKEFENFNKIELLEQIMINSPKKYSTDEQEHPGKLDQGKVRAAKRNLAGNLKGKTEPQAETDSSLEEKPPKSLNEMLGKDKKLISESKKKSLKKITPKRAHSSGKKVDEELEHALEGDVYDEKCLDEVSSEGKLHCKKTSKKTKVKLTSKTKCKSTSKKIKENRSLAGKGIRNRKVNQKSKTLLKNKKTKCERGTKDNIDVLPSSLGEQHEIHSTDESTASHGTSNDEIFTRKNKTTNQTAQDGNDNKENIVKNGTQGSNTKRRCMDSTKELELGNKFYSYDEWHNRLNKLQEDDNGNLYCRDSRSIANALKKNPNRPLCSSLKYAGVSYACVFGMPKPSLQGKKDHLITDCPWKLRLCVSKDGKALMINEVCLDHNHDLDEVKRQKPKKNVKQDLSNQLDSSMSMNGVTPLKNSTRRNCLPEPIIPSPTKMDHASVRAVEATSRRLLSSQDNIKNQVQNILKSPKTKKRSPKRKKKKKKKLSLSKGNIMALQDEVIKEMAESKLIQVNTAIVDENVIVIDDKVVKKIPKKSKIPALVLKPPAKEQKPLKVRATKKAPKKELEEEVPKKKRNSQVKEVAREGLRRTSRRSAANAKKWFQSMTDSEDSDATSDVEVKLDSEIKTPKKGRKGKSKMTKVEKPKSIHSTGKEEKLAPIFCKRPKSPELEIIMTTMSPAKLKARQDFLQSGVPEQIKKQQLVEKGQEEELTASACFPKVSHVQQKDVISPMWNLPTPKIALKKEDASTSLLVPNGSIYQPSMFIDTEVKDQTCLVTHPVLDLTSVVAILTALKKKNLSFPVYSIFKCYLDLKKEAVDSYKRELEKEAKILCINLVEKEENMGPGKRKRRSKDGHAKRGRKSKSGRGRNKQSEVVEVEDVVEIPSLPIWQERIPDVWTHVYAPKKSSQIIGNTNHIQKLKGWLQDWKSKSEAFAIKEKYKKPKSSKKGDGFLVSDDSDSWNEEDDFVSTYLLCGPPGVGKTATVYALATELGYKVLEVNASSKRTGKVVMSQLAEATQSHSVSNTSNQANNAMAAMFAAKSNVPSMNVKSKAVLNLDEESRGSNRDSEKRKGVSLVLFEDIDIVFEESDEGFISTVNNFMTTTKRPIILTVSDPSHSTLSKFKGNYEVLYFEPPPEDLIAHHLQLICLLNGHHICHEDLQSLVCVNQCDVRQSLLDAQVWSNSGSSNKCNCITKSSKGGTNAKQNVEDIPLSDIFPGRVDTHSNVELYRTGLWGKVHCRYVLDLEDYCLESDSVPIPWSQIAMNLPFFLPLPLRKKKEVNKYPLQVSDPEIKSTFLWQKYNWLSIDDEVDDYLPPKVEEKEKEEEEEKEKEQLEVPSYVKDSSKKCIESMTKLLDTFAYVDVLDSHHPMTHPRKEKRDSGWWIQHPVAGLSDLEGQYIHWAPHSVTQELIEVVAKGIVNRCHQEMCDAIEDFPAKEWEQLSLPVQENEKPSLLESQSSASERLLKDHQAINQHVINHVPLVHQLTRGGYMDYLTFVRSTIRHDELSTVVNKTRRGRRFLSNTAQYGIDISAENKIKLANALVCTK